MIGPVFHSTARKVSETAWKLDIPVFYVHSIGFYSHFSIQLPRLFPIVDTHPDPTSTQDLRLLRPWPELLEHMKTATNGLDEMSDHDHGHVPYVLLLLHYLEKWKEAHEGRVPETYKEKTEFRDTVRAGARTNNSEGGEENFDEAVAAVLKSLNAPSIPSGFADTVVIAESRAPSKEVRPLSFSKSPRLTLLGSLLISGSYRTVCIASFASTTTSFLSLVPFLI